MIIEKVTLMNFGIYQGKHEIIIDSKDSSRPVILIGGLNGSGKTTFLDSIQLALYGKHAKTSNRGRLSYSSYLEQNINRYSDRKEASVAVKFRHGDDYNFNSYEVVRYWGKDGSKECKESVVVFNGDKSEPFLSETWDDFVNEFLPQNISDLFFFDGEKIELMAEPRKSAELLKTGIEALIGLDSLSKLSVDMNILKKKKLEDNIDDRDKERAGLVKVDIEIIKDKIKSNDESYKRSQEIKRDLEEERLFLESKLSTGGKNLLELKESLKDDLKKIEVQAATLKSEISRLLSGSLPFKLIEGLINQSYDSAVVEKNSTAYQDAIPFLYKQKNLLLSLLSETTLDAAEISELEIKIETFNDEHSYLASKNIFLGVSPLSFNSLWQKLDEDSVSFKNILASNEILNEKKSHIERNLETIPAPQAMHELLAKNALVESKIAQNDNELVKYNAENEKLKKELECKLSDYNNILLKVNAANFESQRQHQIIEHIDVLREIIDSFYGELINKNIDSLEKRIKSKFDSLKRKDLLFSKVKIDPESFAITLIGSDGNVFPIERFSAGERQLFAISVLWGLADRSGKELPMIIDTPMGRLDGEHRKKLIHNYFPYAAGQVILLSTDEEIYGDYFTDIRRFVAREYRIIYDEDAKTSKFVDGYFGDNDDC